MLHFVLHFIRCRVRLYVTVSPYGTAKWALLCSVKKFLTELLISASIFYRKGVTVKQRFALVNCAYQKSNLTLVGAVAFLMSFIFSGLPNTDYCDDDTDHRHYNTDKFQNHSEHQ